MKNVIYLLTILFAVALMSTSCEKDDPIPNTLETQFPDWVNLSWESTDGEGDDITPPVYPRLFITINGNEVAITEERDAVYAYHATYTNMTIVGNVVTFDTPTDVNDIPFVTGTFDNDGIWIDIITKGISGEEYNYILKIN